MAVEQLGRFRITGVLGKGAMGTVYRAHDPVIDRTVAIKTISCSGLSSDESAAFEERFFREARSAGRLNHPNIVTIHDAGRSDGLAYIAMEFLAGRSLREILDSGIVLPPEQCLRIAAEVADGLAFAHANAVVHRDIKPANIMVQDNGAIKIADFGVAQLANASGTVAGASFGSPKYMSPEQVNGQKVDGRSDIFSLGGVLYEMLTGHPPFAGEELAAVLYRILNDDPPPPTTVQASLPAEFDRVVAKAMAKDATLRYQRAEEFAQDLRRCQRQLLGTDLAAGAAADGDPVPTIRGRRAMYWTIATGLLAGVAAAAWLTIGSRDSITAPTAVPQPVPVPAVVSGPIAEPVARPAGAADAARPIVAAKPAVAAAAAAVKSRQPTTGKLTLAISPWGEVRVDGKPVGIAPPLIELKVTAGRHRIEIRNGGFPPHRQSILVAGGTTVRIKHKFQ